jgi:hypothetical protein
VDMGLHLRSGCFEADMQTSRVGIT